MAETTAARISLIDVHDFGYEALNGLQKRMLDDTMRDGSARWVAVPYKTSLGVGEFGRLGVLLEVSVTSESPVADLTWMAAKAYSYALYTGCADLMKRRATWIGRGRWLGAGSTETCEAMIGPVKMQIATTIIDVPERPTS